jgi:hypothetical protein
VTSELLIDRLYRETFAKATRNPELRATLQAARRFVLDDSMAAFNVDLVFENMFGRTFRQIELGRTLNERVMDSIGRRTCKLLDEMRHFSRLPHRTTWIEYSHEAHLRRQLEIGHRMGLENSITVAPDGRVMPLQETTEMLKSAKGARCGWLLRQIGSTETAFDCTTFMMHTDEPVSFAETAIAWDTEDNLLPFELHEPQHRSRGYNSAAEVLTAIRGYRRNNVGFRLINAPPPNSSALDHIEYRAEIERSIQSHHGEARYLWAFLSTLNKIPLVGIAAVKPSHGFIARGSYRKFLEHSVITINVPQKMTRVLARKVLGEILRRRAHQVRGHWRDDWHQPKGNKALWIAEHQRGDAGLGFVTHDYAVKHEGLKR